MIALRRIIVATAALAVMAPAPPAQAAGRPIETGVLDPQVYWGRGVREIGISPELAFSRLRGDGANVPGAGAKKVRLYLYWSDVAPDVRSATKPSFNDRAWNSPRYNWVEFDRMVVTARRHNLDVIFSILNAPRWAEGTGRPAKAVVGSWKPRPRLVANFAFAASQRYRGDRVIILDGATTKLPRVRYWQLWNEANRTYFLSPQFNSRGALVSPGLYRGMLNAFAPEIRRVPGNLVITSGLAPTGRSTQPSPMAFMRALLCVSSTGKRTCTVRSKFDAWSTHPYSRGGPTYNSPLPNDVTLGGLWKVRRTLSAATRLGHVISRVRPVKFWITEWNWDSNAPDPDGVPIDLHARWVSQALYRMWQNGVSLAIWTQLRDYPFGRDRTVTYQAYQGGLYFWGGSGGAFDQPKLSLTAFRFPFVAFRTSTGVVVWGRTPKARAGAVMIEKQVASNVWAPVTTLTANAYGVFSKKLPPQSTNALRAVFPTAGDTSVPFSLIRPASFVMGTPFGCGGPITCRN